MKMKIRNNSLGKNIILVWIALFVLSACGVIVQASPTEAIAPDPSQYFELKATKIRNVDGRKTINNGTLGI